MSLHKTMEVLPQHTSECPAPHPCKPNTLDTDQIAGQDRPHYRKQAHLVTLTPEQLADLIAAAEAYARAKQVIDKDGGRSFAQYNEAENALCEYAASIPAADYGIIRRYTGPWHQGNIDPNTLAVELRAHGKPLPGAAITLETCSTHGCDRRRNHLGLHRWHADTADSNPSETGL